MRKKRIQEFANNVCQMFVGWRMNDDLELLAELPDGLVKVDLLTGQAEHDKTGPVKLYIATEIRSWLQDQFNKANIPSTAITSAKLDAQIKTDSIPTDRSRIILFDFIVESAISTTDASYTHTLKETHKWHSRTKYPASMDSIHSREGR